MKVTVELIAIELPNSAAPRAATSIWGQRQRRRRPLRLGVDADPALLAMVNGEAVPRDQWPETP